MEKATVPLSRAQPQNPPKVSNMRDHSASQQPQETSTKESVKSIKKNAGPSRMLKEIASHNKPSLKEDKTPLNGLEPYLAHVHNTRQVVEKMNKLASNLLEEAKSEDENIKKVSKKSVASTRPAQEKLPITALEEEAEDGNVGSIPEAEITAPMKEANHGGNDQHQKAEGDKGWKVWKARKDAIQKRVAPGIVAFQKNREKMPPGVGMRIRTPLPWIPATFDAIFGPVLNDGKPNDKKRDDEGVYFSFTTENDRRVLWPSIKMIESRFGDCIMEVGKMGGENVGYAKIIVPNALKTKFRFPHNTSAPYLTDALIRPHKTKLDLHAPLTHGLSTYGVSTLGETRVLLSEWQGWIQTSRSKIIRFWAMDENFIGDVYKKVFFTRTEDDMIERSQTPHDEMYYAESVQESQEIRNALHIGGPYLSEFAGNKLQEPKFKRLEMDRAVFQFSGTEGSPLGLQTTNQGAYSLNFLHRGAPKHWTIVEPAEHKRLEELLHEHVEFAAGRLTKRNESHEPPTHPPRCDRFLWHQPLYVPKETLTAWGIQHEEVIQYEGELIVMFPFTYYQGFSTGPSLAEQIAFGDHRWEKTYNSELFQNCHPNCSGDNIKHAVDPGRIDL